MDSHDMPTSLEQEIEKTKSISFDEFALNAQSASASTRRIQRDVKSNSHYSHGRRNVPDGVSTMTLVNADGSEVNFTYDVVAEEWVPETGFHWKFGHLESLPIWEIVCENQTRWQFDDVTGKFRKEIDAAGNESRTILFTLKNKQMKFCSPILTSAVASI